MDFNQKNCFSIVFKNPNMALVIILLLTINSVYLVTYWYGDSV